MSFSTKYKNYSKSHPIWRRRPNRNKSIKKTDPPFYRNIVNFFIETLLCKTKSTTKNVLEKISQHKLSFSLLLLFISPVVNVDFWPMLASTIFSLTFLFNVFLVSAQPLSCNSLHNRILVPEIMLPKTRLKKISVRVQPNSLYLLQCTTTIPIFFLTFRARIS